MENGHGTDKDDMEIHEHWGKCTRFTTILDGAAFSFECIGCLKGCYDQEEKLPRSLSFSNVMSYYEVTAF